MTSHVEGPLATAAIRWEREVARYLVPIGRVLFAAIFVMTVFGHFKQETIQYAASQGVPFASIAVPVSGIIAFAGGMSIATGYKARVGAFLVIVFLVPVTFMMHAFWNVEDPAARQMQIAMFMKNISMLGAALLLIHHGAGPFSFDSLERPEPRPT